MARPDVRPGWDQLEGPALQTARNWRFNGGKVWPDSPPAEQLAGDGGPSMSHLRATAKVAWSSIKSVHSSPC